MCPGLLSYKNTTKGRFIVGTPIYSVKAHSGAATAALKLIYKQTENYNFKTQYYSGFKTFWLVQSNQMNK